MAGNVTPTYNPSTGVSIDSWGFGSDGSGTKDYGDSQWNDRWGWSDRNSDDTYYGPYSGTSYPD